MATTVESVTISDVKVTPLAVSIDASGVTSNLAPQPETVDYQLKYPTCG